jgi:hypothetical protein
MRRYTIDERMPKCRCQGAKRPHSSGREDTFLIAFVPAFLPQPYHVSSSFEGIQVALIHVLKGLNHPMLVYGKAIGSSGSNADSHASTRVPFRC